jgi:citrate synthase
MYFDKWLNDIAVKTTMVNTIDPDYYKKYNVKQGLRNADGTGVAVGFTKVGSVHGYEFIEGVKTPMDGQLFYRDKEIHDVVNSYKGYGYETVAYLLLFGKLPTAEELDEFNEVLDRFRKLPPGFTENMILKIPSKNIMNKLQRSTLVLYSHDHDPDNTAVQNLLLQSLKLIARYPTIISYGYQAKAHYFDQESLFIHAPQEKIGTAKNILHMIRADNQYTQLEADTLDLLLVLHAEHGGGNNSAFTVHVVSSSGTDTYSAMAAAVGSLKGPKHGGANIKVRNMIDDIKINVKDLSDEKALKNYLLKILNKETFNQKGLIYGMGHAVYTMSDPRAEILKKKAKELAESKDRLEEYMLYSNIEKLTKEIFKEQRDMEICANVDLYSGFVYELLNIPKDLYTPLFAVARIAGWCAHRIEQIVSDKRIIRPAYKSITND